MRTDIAAHRFEQAQHRHRLRHEQRRVHHGREVDLAGLGEVQEQLLRLHDADDLVRIALGDGEARVAAVA